MSLVDIKNQFWSLFFVPVSKDIILADPCLSNLVSIVDIFHPRLVMMRENFSR